MTETNNSTKWLFDPPSNKSAQHQPTTNQPTTSHKQPHSYIVHHNIPVNT